MIGIRRRTSYSTHFDFVALRKQAADGIKKKRKALRLSEQVGTIVANWDPSSDPSRLRGARESVFAFAGSDKRKRTGGRKGGLPFGHDLISMMKDGRRSEDILSMYDTVYQAELRAVAERLHGRQGSDSACNALMQLRQRFVHMYLSRDELLAARLDFASRFCVTFG